MGKNRTDFRAPKKVENAYKRALRRLMESVLPSPNAADLVLKLERLSTERALVKRSGELASRMTNWVAVENARTWREASARSQRSRMLYKHLQKEMSGSVGERVRQIASENALYISTIPQHAAAQLTHEVLRAQQAGSRADTIAKMLRSRYPEIVESRINLISRTEASKANTALTQARSEDLDLDWFEWDTSEDQRVRPSHELMDKVLVSWKELPSPEKLAGEKSTLGHYAPGAAPNCRCYPKPLLSVDDVQWPHKVYTGGRIVRMTRGQFLQLASAPGRRAAA